VIPNEGGRVIDEDGQPVPGIYATGWIKRGPVGLIGHTKGDALETIGFLLEDRLNLPPAEDPSESAIITLLESRGVQYTTWEGWLKLDAHEAKLGANFVNTSGTAEVVRERVKLVPREDMVAISRGQ
jgi:ferredoxin--NADP+ reductase